MENRLEGDAYLYVQERLDRACATLKWCELFPHSRLSHLTTSYSDHVPILLNAQVKNNHNRPRRIPKRLEEKWAMRPACEDLIHQACVEVRTTGSPMFMLFEKKIKKCRMALVG